MFFDMKATSLYIMRLDSDYINIKMFEKQGKT